MQIDDQSAQAGQLHHYMIRADTHDLAIAHSEHLRYRILWFCNKYGVVHKN